MDRHGVGQLSPEGAFQKLPIAESRFQDISSSNPQSSMTISLKRYPEKAKKKLLIQLLLNWDPHGKPHVNHLMGKLESQ